MEVSKITLLPETLNSNTLSRTRRRELREEAIKDYILSKPTGSYFTITELSKISGITNPGFAHLFVTRMVKQGKLSREQIPGKKASIFTVLDNVKVTTPARPAEEDKPAEPTPQPAFSFQTSKLKDFAEAANGWATQQAKEFAWHYNSDSLREFVKFLEAQVHNG